MQCYTGQFGGGGGGEQRRRLGQLAQLNAVERLAVHRSSVQTSARYDHDLTVDDARLAVL